VIHWQGRHKRVSRSFARAGLPPCLWAAAA
jgi:hypothetical protein